MPTIKMGRNEYTFADEDVFLDNGACVQCLTQNGKHHGHGRCSPLKLTQKSIKELDKRCERVEIKDHFHSGKSQLEVFYYKELNEVE